MFDGPMHADADDSQHQIAAEGPQVEVSRGIAGQFDKPEGADREPEQGSEDVARSHEPAFVPALNKVDLGVDGADDGGRLGLVSQPGKG